jgi:hypothetical protein
MRRFLALFVADGDLTDLSLGIMALLGLAGIIAVLAQ